VGAPRPAAAVILLREGTEGPEVLLVKRSPKARFMAATWVFPGGALEPEALAGAQDADAEDRAHREAAIRELREEAEVTLSASTDELVEFARWITPAQLSTRFDARFFLARLPAGARPRVDGEECVDLRWSRPADALEAARAGELTVAFPTIKHLEQLNAFATVDDLIDGFAGRPVSPVEPRVVISGGSAQIVLPGEPGYDEPPPG
jgi:8-oxo-dGTP pyrophosphatase MutT (NUDIX family)